VGVLSLCVSVNLRKVISFLLLYLLPSFAGEICDAMSLNVELVDVM